MINFEFPFWDKFWNEALSKINLYLCLSSMAEANSYVIALNNFDFSKTIIQPK